MPRFKNSIIMNNSLRVGVGAGGGGGGGCYEDFREIAPADLSIEVKECNMAVNLLDDLKRGDYTWTYKIKTISGEPQVSWFFIVPFSRNKISQIWAKYDDGGLQWRHEPEGEDKTKLIIEFRNNVPVNSEYSFCFGYETDIISIVSQGFLNSTVAYNDWCSHNNPCNKIHVKVNFPSRSKVINSVPPTDLSRSPIEYKVLDRRPNEYFSYLLTYKKKKISKPFWIWLLSAVVSGIVGALISGVI